MTVLNEVQTAWFLIKGVYGRELLYPTNITAMKLASLAGSKKTLVPRELALIESLGFDIVLDGSTAAKALVREQIDSVRDAMTRVGVL